jgi:pilus assembly protein Flp/PilA
MVPGHRPRRTGQSATGGQKAVLSKYGRLRALRRREDGQGLVEYALILVLVAIVVIGVLTTMGNSIQAVFSDIVSSLG